MIGVISKQSEVSAVKEFFQLFKTPWEWYVPHRGYGLVITTTGEVPADPGINAIAVYDSRATPLDHETGIRIRPISQPTCLKFNDADLPLYRTASVLESAEAPFLHLSGSSQGVGLEIVGTKRHIVRIGYDLFEEVSFLLSEGQPSENATIPTLELHISLLRSIMLRVGAPYVEVLPVPAGYEFMACLTHDVDFTGIREHKFDSTMWGFVYRALVGSFRDALGGRTSWSKCRRNWRAVFSLPLVYLGLIEDFWLEFDRYMEIEKGLGSTFFFIPFKNYPGTRNSQPAPKRRAAKYDLLTIKKEIRALIDNGCEVGLHGVDAWQGTEQARTELSRIQEVTRQPNAGVRMHWLYWADTSPKALEEAGLSYDSTFGYNDAVGFRAGTAQAFCPLGGESFIELPLIAQDTALFYPDRMGLSETEAMDSCRQLIRQALLFGGVLTINWHTRSLSPERLWGDFYQEFLNEIKEHRVWFRTAGHAVRWFQSRRALQFERVQFVEDGLQLKVSLPTFEPGQPPFTLRIHHPMVNGAVETDTGTQCPYADIPWKGEAELSLVQPEHSRS